MIVRVASSEDPSALCSQPLEPFTLEGSAEGGVGLGPESHLLSGPGEAGGTRTQRPARLLTSLEQH